MIKATFLVIFFLGSITLSNAQFFAGGNFNFNTNGGSIDNGTVKTEKTTFTNYNLSPKAGYIMSDNIWIGMQIGFGVNKSKTSGTPELINKVSQFGVTPFARYYALRNNKFGLFAEGQLGLNFSSSKSESAGTTTDGPKNTAISFSVFPGISFDISDKVTLEAQINGFNLGYSYSVTKSDIAGTESKNKSTNLGFGADLDNIITPGVINIGATIKF